MQIGIIGINHKSAVLSLREKFAKACGRLFSANRSMHVGFSSVFLSTCNRTEIYFQSEDPTETHIYLLNALRREIREEFEHRVYTYFGSDCFFHLACVTAGIDSALVGETEIQGQVKRAYAEASLYHRLAPELHFLFQKCLRIGKNIRSNASFASAISSIEELVYQAATEKLGELRNYRILFVGLSEINFKIIAKFKKKGIGSLSLCNRTDNKVWDFAMKEQIQQLSWKHFPDWKQFDVVIFGTKSPNFLITRDSVHNNDTPKLIIDLSVPRNVDPEVGCCPQITLLNVDELDLDSKMKQKAQERARIETKFIAQAVEKQTNLFRIKELRRHAILAEVS